MLHNPGFSSPVCLELVQLSVDQIRTKTLILTVLKFYVITWPRTLPVKSKNTGRLRTSWYVTGTSSQTIAGLGRQHKHLLTAGFPSQRCRGYGGWGRASHSHSGIPLPRQPVLLSLPFLCFLVWPLSIVFSTGFSLSISLVSFPTAHLSAFPYILPRGWCHFQQCRGPNCFIDLLVTLRCILPDLTWFLASECIPNQKSLLGCIPQAPKT